MSEISVIMSVYNEPPEWLRASIESILNQTFTDFEFIIVNDNPARSELQSILQGYQTKNDHIKILSNDSNIGLTKSLNKALSAAAGRYIARMDADDISLPQRLQLQYEFLESRKEIFLCGSAIRILNQNSKLGPKAVKSSQHKNIIKDIFSGRLAFYHPAIMFRSEGHFYREKFKTAQDFDFYLTLLSAGKKFANLNEVLLHYRMSDQSISGTKRRQQIILKELALKFYGERKAQGGDSYESLDFQDEPQILQFLKLENKNLEARILKEQIVFSLGAGNYKIAKQAFDSYKQQSGWGLETFFLWLFTCLPFVHKIYRKVRYGLTA